MAFCPSCGSTIEGSYCAKCGIPAPGGQPAAAGGLAQNAACALCYLFGFITGILFLVLAPYNQNKTVRFHAFQSIFLHVTFIVFWIVLGMIMPFSVSLILSPLIGLAALVLWILLMWKTYQGQKVKLPVIGDLAEKQA
jgi:uncharacterized membrane protein